LPSRNSPKRTWYCHRAKLPQKTSAQSIAEAGIRGDGCGVQQKSSIIWRRRISPWAGGLALCLSTGGLIVASNPSRACETCVLGYPYSSTNPRTSVAFNESEIMRAFSTNVAGRRDTIRVWYND
jgi:hypothetical protein